MLTYDEFYAMAKADADRCDERGVIPYDLAQNHPDSFIALWVIDGRSHSFDGTERQREPEPEPEIEPLLELLDDLGLKRRQVNEIRRELFEGKRYRQPLDHNGSWADYAYKGISIDDLHGKLVGYGLVEPRPSPAP